MIAVVPAVIPTDLAATRQLIEQLTFATELHLDIVDGEFVPAVSWPVQPTGQLLQLKDLTDQFTFEVDLMVAQPLSWIAPAVAAGADMLVLHIETISKEQFVRLVETTPANVSLVVSTNNQTSLNQLEAYLPYADGVQLMGIAQIGSQGQPFDERVLDKLSWLKTNYPQLPVTVDGSVNLKTISRLVQAGADRLIIGSAIVQAANPAQAYLKCLELAN